MPRHWPAEALDFALQIGAPDAFVIYTDNSLVLRTFAGGHAELFPLVEQAARENPTRTSVQVGLRDHLCRSGSH